MLLLNNLLKLLPLLVIFLCQQKCISLSANTNTRNNAQTNSKMSDISSAFAVNLKFTVKDDRRDDFLTLIRNNQRKTLDLEPKSLQYVVGEDIENKNTFYLHEQFTSSEAFIEHRSMAHAADWVAFKATDPFVGDIEMDSYLLQHDTKPCEPRKAFGVQVVLCVKPQVRDFFFECIAANRAGSMQEPLCYQYAYGESESTPNRFIFHEEYEGKEGFEAHQKTPHFEDWKTFAATDPFTEPPVVNLFESLQL